jgi:hypothetical protein
LFEWGNNYVRQCNFGKVNTIIPFPAPIKVIACLFARKCYFEKYFFNCFIFDCIVKNVNGIQFLIKEKKRNISFRWSNIFSGLIKLENTFYENHKTKVV